MNEIELRLKLAKLGFQRYQPQEEEFFAWLPVHLLNGEWRWLCRVRRFKPLGLWWEYYDV